MPIESPNWKLCIQPAQFTAILLNDLRKDDARCPVFGALSKDNPIYAFRVHAEEIRR